MAIEAGFKEGSKYCNSKQGNIEHEGLYLATIKKMAIEAGFEEGSKLFERYVTNRFIDGINDTLLKERILNIQRNPSIEDLDKICNMSAFDLLIRRNVQHIWEKIFLYLDYESFQKCLTVCRAWNNIFTEESFLAKTRKTFTTKMWMDTKHLERQVWKSSKSLCAWTINHGNGEEVAYIESNDECLSHMVHLINREGKLTSGILKLLKNECVPCVHNIWILNHIILIKTRKHVYSVDKLKLKQKRLFTWSWNDYKCANFILMPNLGVRFLSIATSKNAGVDIFTLKEVSIDHFSVKEWKKDETDKQGCCSFADKSAPILNYNGSNEDRPALNFSEDGSHFIYYSEYEIQVFSINKTDAGMSINRLWNHLDDISRYQRADSRYVMYVGKRYLVLRDIEVGCMKKRIDLSWGPERVAPDVRNTVISQSEISLFISYKNQLNQFLPPTSALVIVDLETLEMRSAYRGAGTEYYDLYAWGGKPQGPHKTFKAGGMVAYPTWDEKNFVLLDLTSYDPNKVMAERKLMKHDQKSQFCTGCIQCKVGKLTQLIELKQGLCIYEVLSKCSSNSQIILNAKGERVNFMIEKIAWKGEKMPKAMDTWVEWLEKAD